MHRSYLTAVLGLCVTFAHARPRFPYRGFATDRKGAHYHGRLASRDDGDMELTAQNLVMTSFTDPITLSESYGPTVIFLFGEVVSGNTTTSGNMTQFVTGAVIPDPSQTNNSQSIVQEAVAQAKLNGVVLAVAMAQANSTAVADPNLSILGQVNVALGPAPVPAAYALLNYIGSPTLLSNFSARPGQYAIDVQNPLTGTYGVNPS